MVKVKGVKNVFFQNQKNTFEKQILNSSLYALEAKSLKILKKSTNYVLLAKFLQPLSFIENNFNVEMILFAWNLFSLKNNVMPNLSSSKLQTTVSPKFIIGVLLDLDQRIHFIGGICALFIKITDTIINSNKLSYT